MRCILFDLRKILGVILAHLLLPKQNYANKMIQTLAKIAKMYSSERTLSGGGGALRYLGGCIRSL